MCGDGASRLRKRMSLRCVFVFVCACRSQTALGALANALVSRSRFSLAQSRVLLREARSLNRAFIRALPFELIESAAQISTNSAHIHLYNYLQSLMNQFT